MTSPRNAYSERAASYRLPSKMGNGSGYLTQGRGSKIVHSSNSQPVDRSPSSGTAPVPGRGRVGHAAHLRIGAICPRGEPGAPLPQPMLAPLTRG